jgi:hypothetical protein
LEVQRTPDSIDWICFPKNEQYKWQYVSPYNTDPAACIRAAEAWRKKDEDIDRTVEVMLAIDRTGPPCTAKCAENYREGDGYKWRTFDGRASDKDVEPFAAALAQALYRATGGPA